MADGVSLNPMNGGVKVDAEDNGVRGFIQRFKFALGNIDTDDGDVSTSNPLPTSVDANALASQPIVGQVTIATTATEVQLPSHALTNGVIITAKSSNTNSITIGGSGVTNIIDGTGNGYILEAGSSISFAVTNTDVLYINGTAGDLISFAGS